jgi:plastocyanin
VDVAQGDSQTFTFVPNTNTHVSAIQVDDQFEPYALDFRFDDVQENHEIQVYFSADGEAYVPAGNNVEVFMTVIRSHYTPDLVELKKGDKVTWHLTSLERTPDATHGLLSWVQPT